jgi:hypothetical protein
MTTAHRDYNIMAVKASGTGSFLIPTAPAVGTTVAGGAANTFTTNAVQLIASTGAAIFITGLHVQLSSTSKPTYVVIRLSTGAGDGSIVGEFVVPYAYTAGATGTQMMGFVQIWPPIAVAASTRIGAKSADSVGSLNHTVILQCINQSNVVAEGAIAETVDVLKWNGTAVSAPATAGIPDVNVKNIDNDAASASGTVTFPNATLASTTNITAGTITTVTTTTTATNVTTVNGLAANVITAASIATGAIDADAIAADAITAAKVAADVTTEIQSGLATAAALATVQADTDNIQTRLPAALSGDGFMKSDLLSIGDELVSGTNATLNLKKLNIVNDVGVAIDVTSSADNAMQLNGLGHGLQVVGQNEAGLTVYTNAVNGNGAEVFGGGTGHGLDIQTGTGKSVNAPQDIAVSDGNLTLAAIAAAVWANATRTLTAISDSAGITTLLTRITAALAIYTAADVRGAVGLASANLDTQLGDLPTNAELATALGTADDAVLAAIAALNNLSQANIRTAVGLATANLDTQLDALPTNAELATALGTADDATLAAIAALNNLSSAQVQTAAAAALTAYDPPTKAEMDTAVDALPTAVENAAATLTAADANPIAANIKEVNNTEIVGDGSTTPWGPA